MSDVTTALLSAALKTAIVLSLPVVCVVAIVGVVIGIIQTIVQVQDQNVAFAPKLAVVALVIFAAGAPALDMLRVLLTTVVSALPLLART